MEKGEKEGRVCCCARKKKEVRKRKEKKKKNQTKKAEGGKAGRFAEKRGERSSRRGWKVNERCFGQSKSF
jgi:hypothetical protein